MTTIIVDMQRGIVGADAQVGHDTHKFLCTKLHKVRRMVIGTSGYAIDGESFERWMASTKKGEPPRLDESFEALVCHENGRVEHYGADLRPLPIEEVNRFFAIGSGGAPALGAVFAGATLEAALEIAARIDPSTGAPFQIINYKKEKA
jgi:ATP-dependent protease HslVU (ClpYQ) peptidase subunit